MSLKIIQGIYSFILVFITFLLNKYFTDIGLDNFYETLNLPNKTPQNNYFSYAWYTLYFLLFLSFFMVLISDKTYNQFLDANALFIMQLFLQILWTYSFFYLEQIFVASIVIVLLDIIVALMLHTFFYINVWSFVIAIPYFLWLLFASYLNIYISEIN